MIHLNPRRKYFLYRDGGERSRDFFIRNLHYEIGGGGGEGFGDDILLP